MNRQASYLPYVGTFLACLVFAGSLASAWFTLQARVGLLEFRLNNQIGEDHPPTEGK